MTSIRIPPGVRFPVLTFDPIDDALELDAGIAWALMAANPQLEWNEDTLVHVLAHWYLHEVEAGCTPALPALDLPLVMPSTLRRH